MHKLSKQPRIHAKKPNAGFLGTGKAGFHRLASAGFYKFFTIIYIRITHLLPDAAMF